MPYCSRCGVEVHKEIRTCPLCRAKIQQFPEDGDGGRPFPPDELPAPRPPRMTPKERRRLIIILTALGIMIPILITLAVDITLNQSLSWSLYPVAALSASFLIVLTTLYMHQTHPFWMIFLNALLIAGTLVFLFLKGLVCKTILVYTLPLLALGMILSQGITKLSILSKRREGNVAAFINLGTGIFCFSTEAWLDWLNTKRLQPGWSLIVLAAIIPVSLILLYLHYRKKEGFLRRYFHI